MIVRFSSTSQKVIEFVTLRYSLVWACTENEPAILIKVQLTEDSNVSDLPTAKSVFPQYM